MSRENMGMLEYIAWLESEEARLRAQLEDVRNATKHAKRAMQEVGQRAELPTHPRQEAATEDRAKKNGEEGGTRREGPYAGMGVEEAAHAYLRSLGGVAKTRAIADGLLQGGLETDAKKFISTVFSSLRRLDEKGLVEKVRPGVWRATSSDNRKNADEQTELTTES